MQMACSGMNLIFMHYKPAVSSGISINMIWDHEATVENVESSVVKCHLGSRILQIITISLLVKK